MFNLRCCLINNLFIAVNFLCINCFAVIGFQNRYKRAESCGTIPGHQKILAIKEMISFYYIDLEKF